MRASSLLVFAVSGVAIAWLNDQTTSTTTTTETTTIALSCPGNSSCSCATTSTSASTIVAAQATSIPSAYTSTMTVAKTITMTLSSSSAEDTTTAASNTSIEAYQSTTTIKAYQSNSTSDVYSSSTSTSVASSYTDAKVVINPPGAQYMVMISPNNSAGIYAQVVATTDANGFVNVTININGKAYPPELGPYGYHIHTQPVTPGGNCSDAGSHLDPYNRGENPPCDQSAPETCQVGDLSGKHGAIHQLPGFSTHYTDKFLSLDAGVDASAFIGNRSLVLHYANKTRIACGNFEPVSPLYDGSSTSTDSDWLISASLGLGLSLTTVTSTLTSGSLSGDLTTYTSTIPLTTITSTITSGASSGDTTTYVTPLLGLGYGFGINLGGATDSATTTRVLTSYTTTLQPVNGVGTPTAAPVALGVVAAFAVFAL